MSERLTWTPNTYGGEEGRAGGLRLFSVHYGVRRDPERSYSLSTELPVKHPSLGQHYPTTAHAKVAAERLLAAFIAKVDQPANPTKPETATPESESADE